MNLLEIAFGGMMRNTPFLASLPSVGIVKLFSHFEKKAMSSDQTKSNNGEKLLYGTEILNQQFGQVDKHESD